MKRKTQVCGVSVVYVKNEKTMMMFYFENKKKCYLLILLFIVGGIIYLHAFGNPQLIRSVYMFQAYIYPKPDGMDISPPENYTGIWLRWYSNGRLMSKENYINGKLANMNEFWFENGNISSRSFYDNDGLLHGVLYFWHSNGKKHILGYYNHGFRCGEWMFWDEKGNLIEKRNYDNSRPMQKNIPEKTEEEQPRKNESSD